MLIFFEPHNFFFITNSPMGGFWGTPPSHMTWIFSGSTVVSFIAWLAKRALAVKHIKRPDVRARSLAQRLGYKTRGFFRHSLHVPWKQIAAPVQEYPIIVLQVT